MHKFFSCCHFVLYRRSCELQLSQFRYTAKDLTDFVALENTRRFTVLWAVSTLSSARANLSPLVFNTRLPQTKFHQQPWFTNQAPLTMMCFYDTWTRSWAKTAGAVLSVSVQHNWSWKVWNLNTTVDSDRTDHNNGCTRLLTEAWRNIIHPPWIQCSFGTRVHEFQECTKPFKLSETRNFKIRHFMAQLCGADSQHRVLNTFDFLHSYPWWFATHSNSWRVSCLRISTHVVPRERRKRGVLVCAWGGGRRGRRRGMLDFFVL